MKFSLLKEGNIFLLDTNEKVSQYKSKLLTAFIYIIFCNEHTDKKLKQSFNFYEEYENI